MQHNTLKILTVGETLLEEHLSSLNVRYRSVETLTEATQALRRAIFDVVILRIDDAESANVEWIRRLRSAKPFLTVLALSDDRGLAKPVESALRSAGVTALFCTGQSLLRSWLASRCRQPGWSSPDLPSCQTREQKPNEVASIPPVRRKTEEPAI